MSKHLGKIGGFSFNIPDADKEIGQLIANWQKRTGIKAVNVARMALAKLFEHEEICEKTFKALSVLYDPKEASKE